MTAAIRRGTTPDLGAVARRAFDLTDDSSVRQAAAGSFDAVAHLAAVASGVDARRDPGEAQLNEELQASAFRVHPYHHETIGDMADPETIQRDDLYGHYRKYYIPNNAVLALTGDFNTSQIIDEIHASFGPIRAGAVPTRQRRIEPPQMGERRTIIEGPGGTTYVQFGFHVPQASDPDFFPLTVLDSLLSGPSSLNMFGGGISNKTSRLYKTLVEGELAVGVYGGLQATIDPFLYTLLLTIHPERTAEEAIRAVEDEIKRIQDTPPSPEELARAPPFF